MLASEIDYSVEPQIQNRSSNLVPHGNPDNIQQFLADAGRFLCDEFWNHPRPRGLGLECERLARIGAAALEPKPRKETGSKRRIKRPPVAEPRPYRSRNHRKN